MRFPDYERVIYSKNPLVEVICQFRFPRILEIETKLPAEFQNKIRENYPYLEMRDQFSIGSVNISPIKPQVGEAPLLSKSMIYDFISEDRSTQISLGSEFISVTTESYRRWEEFRGNLDFVLNNFMEIYRVPGFTRIGLRYKDLISRSSLGIEGEKWSDLLKLQVAGLLSQGDTVDLGILEIMTVFTTEIHGGHLRVRHGIVENVETEEVGYLVDGDFFTSQDNIIRGNANGCLEVLDGFNRQAGSFFRWCITDKLHQALCPISP